MNNFKTSQNGIDLIKKAEGFSAKAYKCPAGVLTIGYGHVIKPGDATNIITEKMGEDLLQQDLKIAERAVNKGVLVPINQNQFDALVSFVFNLGDGHFRSSTLLRKLNDGDYAGASRQFKAWVYSGNKILPGLVKRREAEAALFLTKDTDHEKEVD